MEPFSEGVGDVLVYNHREGKVLPKPSNLSVRENVHMISEDINGSQRRIFRRKKFIVFSDKGQNLWALLFYLVIKQVVKL